MNLINVVNSHFPGATTNAKWEIDSQNGNILGAGRVESASNFKDYAEYFESADGKKIESGYLVTLEGDKIRKALKGDEMLGVILRQRAWY